MIDGALAHMAFEGFVNICFKMMILMGMEMVMVVMHGALAQASTLALAHGCDDG